MKTLRLWLEADEEIARFSRLHWEFDDVSVRDVIVDGVHPWLGHDRHLSMVEAFLTRLNAPEVKFPQVTEMGYGYDLSRPGMHGWGNYSPVERMLHSIKASIVFADDLDVIELMEIAERRLRERWTHSMVKDLANVAYPAFQELRRFLKKHDEGLKLSGYDDLDRYDLSRVLSLEAFDGQDKLKLSHGIPTLNFRNSTVLDDVTDSQNRLRLVQEIAEFSLAEQTEGGVFTGLVYRCKHRDGRVRLYPDIGGSDDKRQRAYSFAKEWRMNEGRLCFDTSLDKVVHMVEKEHMVPSFPTLDYVRPCPERKATGVVSRSNLIAYAIGPAIHGPHTIENLREILREHSVPMTGTKQKLLQKIANLAAQEYNKHEEEMAGFFRQNQFVLAAKKMVRPRSFPVLEDDSILKQFLLGLYVLRHLRGNTILDPGHVNDAYTVDELALAMAERRTTVDGMFLPVN